MVANNSINFPIFTASGTLTNAQIKALHGTPVQIIPALGANIMCFPLAFSGSFNYGGNNAFTAGAGQAIDLAYSGASGMAVGLIGSSIITNAMIISTTSRLSSSTAVTGAPGLSTSTPSSFVNQAVFLYNPVATEITGNASNDNTISYLIMYTLALLPS